MKFTPVTKLRPGMMLGQSLLGIAHAEKYVLGTPLAEADITFFEEKGLSGVYTLETQPAQILSPDLMRKCFTAIKKTDIDAMIPLAKQLAAELTERPLSLDFFSIRSYKDYLLHHSVCVAVYSVAIGIRLGMVSSQLTSLALAGLLHDIGKNKLEPSILIKKDALTQEEYGQIKRHPEEGYELLKSDARIPAPVLDAVLHHHENMNGTGYPANQNEENIGPLSRILHVADVYDAIMSKRPYKKGMSGAEAMNYLIGGKNILFDERIVDKFLEIAVPFPTGSEVRLSNEKTALVIGQTSDCFRPLIYIEAEQCLINLEKDNDYRDITILVETEAETASPATAPQEPLLSANQLGLPKKKILIVDDVFVSIAHTKRALGPDYQVVTCLGGSKAAMTVREERPDLILMDYEMPDMDGVTAVHEIQKLGYQIPIIFLTGKCDKETVRACSRCGAVDYILKPANPVYLRARIAMILNQIDRDVF